MIPNDIFPIVRNTFPTTLHGELFQEQPLTKENTVSKKKIRIGFFWSGGYHHEFLKGWSFRPYILQFKIFEETSIENEDCVIGINYIKDFFKITLLKIKSEKLYKKLKGE